MIQMLFKTLKDTDWETLSDFVSPVFFEVVPTFGMAGVFTKIIKDYTDNGEFKRVREQVRNRISSKLNIDILERSGNNPDFNLTDENEKKAFGEKVLEIYFSQIFFSDVCILDLRKSAFQSPSSWRPNSIYYRWSPEFLNGIKNMYRGFYEDDNTAFRLGLKALDLLHAEEIFRNQFGAGRQEAVVFKLSEFKKSFHSIFLSCKTNRTKLHPDFFALGVYLICLYENLENLDTPFNVRESFFKGIN